ncbi:MAG: hypothetical protein M2R45_04989 [Verrucomicrobia subdivision 3 bacterium]|nr:hypothetical protein [Limisphaerales bacterium]MCS1415586.1 hypothetical protein [Limisphaerales bacterium]
MKKLINQFDELSRRDFACYLAKSFLGVGLGLPTLRARGSEGSTIPLRSGTAKRVIYLYMTGGMSHLDTLDPKSDAEVRGPVETIGTIVAGIQVSEHMARLAKQVDKVSLIRSLSSNQGAHERGRYFMRTGYTQRGTIRHPATGAWTMRFIGKLNQTLPGYVTIGGDSRHPGAGFMEAKFAPLPIGDPSAGLQNSRLPRGVTMNKMRQRLQLVNQLDGLFKVRYDQRKVRAYTDAYRDAISLMNSQDLQAFDISQEAKATQSAYGDNAFGQGCLLARRLIEKDVRFVEVSSGGWDTHQNNFERISGKAAELDRALSTLLADLEGRGLLEDTLVVLATEFGRTPKINQNTGRDHYPKAFSCLMAGGGIKGGYVHGATDEMGAEVTEDEVSIPDFNATIAHALGLPQDEVVMSDSGRPFTVAHKGKPIEALFA